MFKTIDKKDLVKHAYENICSLRKTAQAEIKAFEQANWNPTAYKYWVDKYMLYEKQAFELYKWLVGEIKE